MASSSSPRVWNYDVFLSFCGIDTRRTFLSHLHNALVRRGIATFKDDREIDTGDSISNELREAIQTSRFAILVISKNYATSSWCLDELRLIMDLEMKEEIKVIPIFYGVVPSDVRHQRGSFSLERYQGSEMAERVLGWRNALTLLSDCKGHISTQSWEDEAKMIEDIVKRISSRLLSMLPLDFSHLVGMEAHMEQINPLLDMDSKKEVRMIGIWGMGGIGKTTIAEYLYENLRHQFSSRYCFIRNIRETSIKHGLVYIQDLLLTNILGKVDEKLCSVNQGSNQIKLRLGKKRVFIVLDDVDNVEQLYALAKEATWFGPGSRIIITTRDKSVFNPSHVVYDVKCLDYYDALKLFQHIAFEGERPPVGFEDLAWLGHGLPLALQALGLYFRGMPPETWERELELFPYENITNILKVSYKSLTQVGKTAFLHVACLFNGDPLWRAKSLLDNGESKINLLAQKSLIDISTGYIVMHALVEETGREIVRQESGYQASQQRILWCPRDICTVLANNAGTSKSEAVVLHVCEMPYRIPIQWDFFKPMENLSFLKIYEHYETLDPITRRKVMQNFLVLNELRLLHWDSYPFTTLPSGIYPKYLVELNLRYSKLKTLWSGTPALLHLRRLDLTGSKDLKEIPNLQEAVCLEDLLLEGCISLKRFPESISSLSRLKKLDVSNCDGLSNLRIIVCESNPTVFQGISSGKCLRLRSICLEFDDLKELSLTNLSIKGKIYIKLERLEGDAEHVCFVSQQQIPDELMMLEKEPKLMSHPYRFKLLDVMRLKYSKRKYPFDCYSFSDFPWLKELNLINLNIQKIPDDIKSMVVLEKLDLSGNDFKELPTQMNCLKNLKHLTLCNCRSLEELPQLSQLERLTLSDCANLGALMNLPHAEQVLGGYSLLELWLDNCNNVQSLSDQLTRYENLTYLDISRHDFARVPTSIRDLSMLVTLCLNYCTKLKSLTDLPLSLKYLYAHGCNSLETFSLSINHSVDHLDLTPCFHRKKNYSKFIRFPIGRRGEEALVCACQQVSKIPRRNQVRRSPMSCCLQRFKPFLWFCAFFFIIMGVEFILHVSHVANILGLSDRTLTTVSTFIKGLVMGIFLYKRF